MKSSLPMAKKNTEEKGSLLHYLDENIYAEWLIQHGKTLLIGAACALLILLIGWRLFSGSQNINEYIKADKEWGAILSTTGEAQKEAVQGLESTLKRVPELRTKFDALLAQQFLLEGNASKAETFANPVLKRTEKNKLPFYIDFSQITLLISQGNFQKALDQTLALKQKMIEQPLPHNFGDGLFAFNLLRQALLYQQLGDLANEKKTWQELKQYARLVKEAPPTDLFGSQAFTEMFAQYEQGRVTLKEYIETR